VLRDPNVTGLFDSEAAARAVDMLLAEDVGVTRARERSEFDRACRRSDGRLVLFGSGNLGRQTLARLRQDGIEPLAFSDNSRGNWGRDIDGVRVLSPTDAATRYGASALFVVTIWNDRQRFAEFVDDRHRHSSGGKSWRSCAIPSSIMRSMSSGTGFVASWASPRQTTFLLEASIISRTSVPMLR